MERLQEKKYTVINEYAEAITKEQLIRYAFLNTGTTYLAFAKYLDHVLCKLKEMDNLKNNKDELQKFLPYSVEIRKAI